MERRKFGPLHTTEWRQDTSSISPSSRKRGDYFTAQASILFSAFTHEAFLNTLGPKIITFWEAVEFLSPSKKLTIITASLKYKPVFGECPYLTLQSLFAFRNAIAHGRAEELKLGGKTVSTSKSNLSYVEAVGSKWVVYCTFHYRTLC